MDAHSLSVSVTLASEVRPASALMQQRYRDSESNLPSLFLPFSFLFPEVSRVSEEDGSAIKQLAVKVTDRRVPPSLPID